MERKTPDAPVAGRPERPPLLTRLLVRLRRPTPLVDIELLRGRALRVLVIVDEPIDAGVLREAAREIHAAEPGSIMDVATDAGSAAAARAVPFVNDVIAFDGGPRGYRDAERALRRGRPYDVVVDATSLAPDGESRAVALMLASRAPFWLGEAGRANEELYTMRVPRLDRAESPDDRVTRLTRALLPQRPRLVPRPSLTSTEERRRAGA